MTTDQDKGFTTFCWCDRASLSIAGRIYPVTQQAVMQALTYQVEKWRRQDWRKGTRHYSSELRQNLFGEWVVSRCWGRVSAHQGQSLEQACDSYEEGLAIMSIVEKRRFQHGYEAI